MQRGFIIAVLAFTFSPFVLWPQKGRIQGNIIDAKTGETLPGATVRLEGTTLGAAADMDGRFVLTNVAKGEATLVVSYLSYATKKVSISVAGNDVADLSVGLEAATSDSLQEVVVVATMNRENNAALVLQQKNSASMSDGISAEAIRRTPDRSGSDVLRRVSGVTIQDDRYVVVRGLNERYNAAYLNGAPLPSTEPDKKAFAFDLFPANMLDNIVVNKTATPDMPSEFAGGIVQINTKSIPEKSFLSVAAGSGFNSITTGQSKTTYKGGSMDRFGFDDGSRDIPAGVPSHTDKDSWISSDRQAEMASKFPNNWDQSTSVFAPNSVFQLAGGYNMKRNNRDYFGVIFSAGYNSTQNLYVLERSEYDGLLVNDRNTTDVEKERGYVNRVSQAQTSTGALLNLSLRINDDNSVSLKNLFCGAADNRFVEATGSNNLLEQDRVINRVNTRYFSANRLLTSQLSGDHYFTKGKWKFQWNGSFSNVNRAVPDFRVMSYSRFENFLAYDPSEGPNRRDTMYKADIATSTGPSYAGYRVYSALSENMYSGKMDVSKQLKLNSKWKLDVKGGGLYQDRRRQFDMRSFGMSQYSNMSRGIYADDSLRYLSEDQIFSPQNMGVTPVGTGGFRVFENTKEDDNYFASSALAAGYLMGELRFTDKLRAIAGARNEYYTQLLTVNYMENDSIYVNNGVNDILPSVNIVYSFNEKLGVRMAYYNTLNRPEFRELAKINWFDPETRLSVSGSPELTRCYIRNFDARFEAYPGKGQLFTVTGFYKNFVDPIERFMLAGSENQVVYRNAKAATAYGAELEFRVILGSILKKDSSRILNNLALFSNLSVIKSEVNVESLNDKVAATRPMQGQAPYIINTGITYADSKKGFSCTFMLNRVGPRIYIVGNDQIPDRWENARTVADVQFTKVMFKKKLELRLNIRDLFQQSQVIYYKGTSGSVMANYRSDADFANFTRNYGTVYTIAASYKF